MKETIVDVFNSYINNIFDDIHTILPGKIETYYGHSERKAKVKPLIKLKNNRDKIVQIQSIDNVPVIFPSTNSFNLLFPLNSGDGVLLLFSESSIGNFLNSNIEQDADDSQKFSLTDCIAIPGLFSFRSIPKPTPENDKDLFLIFQNAKIQIKDSTNSIIIKNNAGQIEIDAAGNIILDNGTEPYIKGTVFDTWITNVLISLYNSHTHPAPGGVTGAPNAPLTPPINYLSTRIKGL